MAKEPKKVIDWDLIEADWRAGIKTKQQMSTQYGVSRAAMDKRFAKLGITRHLAEKIRAKTESMVNQSILPEADPLSPAAEREIVDANATMQTGIILAHRKDIQRSRRLTMSLLEELEAQTDNQALLLELGEMMFEPDDKGNSRRLEQLEKALTLASRTSTMKTLADSLRTLIAMERQAFGLDEKDDEGIGSGVEDVIRRVSAKHGGD